MFSLQIDYMRLHQRSVDIEFDNRILMAFVFSLYKYGHEVHIIPIYFFGHLHAKHLFVEKRM